MKTAIGIALALSLAGWGSRDADAASAARIDAGDYEGLQEAADALPDEGGCLYLPPGRHELRQPLIIRQGDLRIEGAGPSTHLINLNEDGAPAVVVQPPGIDEDASARIWRVQLSDFRISGNPKSGDGLLARGVNEIYLDGIWIDHNGGNGASLIDCYEDPRVANSIFTYNGAAGLNILRGHDIVVSANQFEENQDALRCIDSFNLCMTGNNLDDHLRHGVVIENTYGSVLSGNMIEECQGTAVILDRDCYGNTISANVIAHDFGGGVDLRDAWGCAVSANTFTIVSHFGVRIGPDSGRITVTGNNFSNAHIGGDVKRDDISGGVWGEAAADCVISGNVFGGMADSAIRWTGDSKVLVGDNLIVDWARHRKGAAPPVEAPAVPLSDRNTIVNP